MAEGSYRGEDPTEENWKGWQMRVLVAVSSYINDDGLPEPTIKGLKYKDSLSSDTDDYAEESDIDLPEYQQMGGAAGYDTVDDIANSQVSPPNWVEQETLETEMIDLVDKVEEVVKEEAYQVVKERYDGDKQITFQKFKREVSDASGDYEEVGTIVVSVPNPNLPPLKTNCIEFSEKKELAKNVKYNE
jgi:hypothetical protein